MSQVPWQQIAGGVMGLAGSTMEAFSSNNINIPQLTPYSQRGKQADWLNMSLAQLPETVKLTQGINLEDAAIAERMRNMALGGPQLYNQALSTIGSDISGPLDQQEMAGIRQITGAKAGSLGVLGTPIHGRMLALSALGAQSARKQRGLANLLNFYSTFRFQPSVSTAQMMLTPQQYQSTELGLWQAENERRLLLAAAAAQPSSFQRLLGAVGQQLQYQGGQLMSQQQGMGMPSKGK